MKIATLLSLLLLFLLSGCDTRPPGGSPPGYDLGAPEKFVMSEDLHEISGIALINGKADTIYAIEDEDGKIFSFHPGDHKWPAEKFGKHGDYEDVTTLGDSLFVVLRSDGSLFTFPHSFIGEGNRDSVTKFDKVLPEGEYEGLYGDSNGSLVALCKNCKQDEQRDEATGYVLRKDSAGAFVIASTFVVDVTGVKMSSPTKKKIKFHPSALARHPITRQWYILSSVNKLMLILNDQWKVVASYQLNVNLFKQPEGLTFDARGNMYISNEGDEGDGNVLLFRYNQSNKYEKVRKDR